MKSAAEIRAWLNEQIAAILGVSEDEIDPDDTFDSFGLASRDAVSLSGDLEDFLGRRLSPTLLYQYPTVRGLADYLAGTEAPAHAVEYAEQAASVKAELAAASAARAHEFHPAKQAKAIGEPLSANVPAQFGEPAHEPIAIIGLACRLPGADNASEFWRLLAEGRDAISEVPDGRWDREGLYDPQVGASGKMSTKWGGFLADLAHWDAHFFGVSPREASRMDPQQRLLLEASWEALEDAGMAADRLAGSNTGVFIGVSANDYSRLQTGVPEHADAYMGTGNAFSITANRISYHFDFRGPSMAVDTACSSSLLSVHLACSSLASGECDLALAGGVNVILTPEITISFSQAHMMAADGRCKTFDAAADGYVRGEGAGMVALKRLSDAERDGDRILAVIRGSAVNQDGRSNGLTAPNPEAQRAVITQALANAGVLPSQVSYIEAHGTGTSLGDPIEVRGLAAALSPGRPEGLKAAIGSVKTNIGHLESAAGIASLIKVVLMQGHKQIPPSLHFERPNPLISFDAVPVAVQTRLGPWQPVGDLPRIAGISAFGFGGTNVHLVVVEHVDKQEVPCSEPVADRPYLLNISARSATALERQARAWLDFLSVTGACPEDIAYSASALRSHHEFRLSLVGTSVKEWCDRLTEYLAGETGTGLCCDQPVPHKAHRVALVFSGQGTQWAGMGQGLLSHEPVFGTEVEAIDGLWKPLAGWSIVDALQSADRLDQTEVAQPAIFAIQAGITALLRSWELPIEGVTGHSVGEIAAAYTGGILTLADAVRVLYHRSRLMQAATGLGKMAAVGVSEAQARELIRGHEGMLSVAAINSPRLVTLSGDASALEAVVTEVQARGIFCRMLQVNYAFHSPQMEPLLEELHAAVAGVQLHPAKLVVASTVTGRRATEADFGTDYWPRNVRQTVRFSDAIKFLASEGFDAFIEVSPHGGMVQSIAECLPVSNDCRVVGSLKRGTPERASLLAAVAQLYTCGIAPTSATQVTTAKRVDIPHYAWEREYYWSQVPTDRGLAPSSVAARPDGTIGAGQPQVHPLLGHRISSPALQATVFEQALSTRGQSYLADHRIVGAGEQPVPVLPATAYLEMLLAAGAVTLPDGSAAVEEVNLARALPLSREARTAQVIVSRQEAQIFSQGNDGQWVMHAGANLRADGQAQSRAATLDETRLRCPEALDAAEFYRGLAEHGLHYGPAFQGVDSLWRGDCEALGHIALASTTKTEGYLLHPALLDACFHLVAAALPAARNKGEEFVYLPVAVERLWMVREHAAARTAYANARIRAQGAPGEDQTGDVVADLTVTTESGALLAEVMGLRVRPVHRKLLAMMIGPGEELAPEQVAAGLEPVEQTVEAKPPERIEEWIYDVEWQEAEALPPEEQWAKGLWLLLADQGEVASGLAGVLASKGGSVWLAYQAPAVNGEPGHDAAPGADDTPVKWMGEGVCLVDGRAPAALRDLVGLAAAAGGPLRGAVYLWGLDAQPGDAGQTLPGLLHLTQALARTPAASTAQPPRMWILTRNGAATSDAESCRPEQAAMWGFGNVAALEHPELKPVRLDAGADVTPDAVAAELAEPGHEDRVALRGAKRLVARLRRAQLPPASAGVASASGQDDAPVRLEITERGMLDNMARVPMTRVAPGPGQVEIQVRAAGLNFRDVMNVLGLYPGDAGLLGGECAGVVVRAGPGVERLRVGDRVMGIAPGCFGAFTTTHAELVTRVPSGLTFEEAATIPIAFLTAHYALDRLGKMAAGERVLIHAASGGVGLAAIQLAQLAGAEVFATAGSPAKRDFLQGLGLAHVMNSRNLAFSDETIAQTGGRGVDLVLNSLADQFIPKSLAALAPNGRFLEIGKVGIWDAAQVRKVRPEASYYTIALDDLSARQPELIGAMLAELVQYFEAGRLKPLPATVYPIEKASDGFRLMAQTRHIGKIVISQEAVDTPAGRVAVAALRQDATYLITGGTGALGTLVAHRLINMGARHLVLAAVTQPSEAGAKAIAEMKAAGADVSIVITDVSQPLEAAELLSSLNNGGSPPLRGIIHAAGILDDGVILQQSWQRFERVLAPKTAGAWNLHALTSKEPLDFFVLFSSVASLLGSPGQANYAAANGFMDGLAALRLSEGLPGLSINWGPWAAGMAAVGDERDRKRREASGIAAIEPQKGLAVLERLITSSAKGERGVAPITWEAFATQFGPDDEPALLKNMIAEARKRKPGLQPKPVAGATSRGGMTDLAKRLETAPPRDRMGIMVAFIRERTLKVLALDAGYPLDTRKPMNEMGLDSLMAIELKNALDAGIGRKLPTTLVFEHPTIEAMAKHLLEGVLGLTIKAGDAAMAENKVEAPISDANAAGITPAERPAGQPALSEEAVAAMSEEEAEAALLQKLAELDE